MWSQPAETLNQQWCRQLVRVLVNRGVGFAIGTPGSRNTPLLEALGTQEEIPCYSLIDERGAGFFALGKIRRTGQPGVVVCTSGTAVAEFHPAVMEARYSRTPLIVLSADRPATLTDRGANQSPRQDQILADSTRWSRRLPRPRPNERSFQALKDLVSRALRKACGVPSGPVHLNQPLAKPLVPDLEAHDGIDPGPTEPDKGITSGPGVDVVSATPSLSSGKEEYLRDRLVNTDRLLMVAGPTRWDESHRWLGRLSTSLKAPLLADVLSGLRFGEKSEYVVDSAGGIVESDLAEELEPDLVLRSGGRLTSKPLRRWLGQLDCPVYQIDSHPGEWEDPEGYVDRVYEAVPDLLFQQGMHEHGDYYVRWKQAEENFNEAVQASGRQFDTYPQGLFLKQLFDSLPGGTGVFLGNSSPVRDAERFVQSDDRSLKLLASRGCSGIDGQVSTGLGAAHGDDRDWLVILGDVTAYHDMNGLLAGKRLGVDPVVVILNNHGGGIFDWLPVRDHDPPYGELVSTPHEVDFDHGSRAFSWNFRSLKPGVFMNQLKELFASDEPEVVEVPLNSEGDRQFREQVRSEYNLV